MSHISTPGPPAWSWDEYEHWLWPEWQKCLRDNASDEAPVHHFLEQNPCLLPGGEASAASIGGHHGPFPGAVISKPLLPGTFSRQPDFMWPTKMSSVFMPVLLEIERPEKRWFTAKGQQTATLTQAMNQVAEWRTWLNSEANKLVFYEKYGISSWIRSYFQVQPVFGLVYGRRAEFAADARLSVHRESIRPEWLHWSTYDGLAPSADARRRICVRVKEGAGWEVVAIPPTFEFSDHAEDDLQGIVGLDRAIIENPLLSGPRKQYLLDQLSRITIKQAASPNLWELDLHLFLEGHGQYEPQWEPPDAQAPSGC